MSAPHLLSLSSSSQNPSPFVYTFPPFTQFTCKFSSMCLKAAISAGDFHFEKEEFSTALEYYFKALKSHQDQVNVSSPQGSYHASSYAYPGAAAACECCNFAEMSAQQICSLYITINYRIAHCYAELSINEKATLYNMNARHAKGSCELGQFFGSSTVPADAQNEISYAFSSSSPAPLFPLSSSSLSLLQSSSSGSCSSACSSFSVGTTHLSEPACEKKAADSTPGSTSLAPAEVTSLKASSTVASPTASASFFGEFLPSLFSIASSSLVSAFPPAAAAALSGVSPSACTSLAFLPSDREKCSQEDKNEPQGITAIAAPSQLSKISPSIYCTLADDGSDTVTLSSSLFSSSFCSFSCPVSSIGTKNTNDGIFCTADSNNSVCSTTNNNSVATSSSNNSMCQSTASATICYNGIGNSPCYTSNTCSNSAEQNSRSSYNGSINCNSYYDDNNYYYPKSNNDEYSSDIIEGCAVQFPWGFKSTRKGGYGTKQQKQNEVEEEEEDEDKINNETASEKMGIQVNSISNTNLDESNVFQPYKNGEINDTLILNSNDNNNPNSSSSVSHANCFASSMDSVRINSCIDNMHTNSRLDNTSVNGSVGHMGVNSIIDNMYINSSRDNMRVNSTIDSMNNMCTDIRMDNRHVNNSMDNVRTGNSMDINCSVDETPTGNRTDNKCVNSSMNSTRTGSSMDDTDINNVVDNMRTGSNTSNISASCSMDNTRTGSSVDSVLLDRSNGGLTLSNGNVFHISNGLISCQDNKFIRTNAAYSHMSGMEEKSTNSSQGCSIYNSNSGRRENMSNGFIQNNNSNNGFVNQIKWHRCENNNYNCNNNSNNNINSCNENWTGSNYNSSKSGSSSSIDSCSKYGQTNVTNTSHNKHIDGYNKQNYNMSDNDMICSAAHSLPHNVTSLHNPDNSTCRHVRGLQESGSGCCNSNKSTYENNQTKQLDISSNNTSGNISSWRNLLEENRDLKAELEKSNIAITYYRQQLEKLLKAICSLIGNNNETKEQNMCTNIPLKNACFPASFDKSEASLQCQNNSPCTSYDVMSCCNSITAHSSSKNHNHYMCLGSYDGHANDNNKRKNNNNNNNNNGDKNLQPTHPYSASSKVINNDSIAIDNENFHEHYFCKNSSLSSDFLSDVRTAIDDELLTIMANAMGRERTGETAKLKNTVEYATVDEIDNVLEQNKTSEKKVINIKVKRNHERNGNKDDETKNHTKEKSATVEVGVQVHPEELKLKKKVKQNNFNRGNYSARSEGEIIVICRAWLNYAHPRSIVFWGDQVNIVLAKIARGCDRNDDPVLGLETECVLWRGELSAQNLPIVWLRKAKQKLLSECYVNRVLAFLYADEYSFRKLEKKNKKAFIMSCGNQACINLTHICVSD